MGRANTRPTMVATTATLIDWSVPLIRPARSVEKSGGKYSVNVSQICRTSVTAVIGLILVAQSETAIRTTAPPAYRCWCTRAAVHGGRVGSRRGAAPVGRAGTHERSGGRWPEIAGASS